jgi:glycosyltransferase involved in cell wall biosynthesis
MKTIVLIPAYNSENEIYEVFKSLEKVHNYYDEIIIIDDCSADDTLKSILSIKKNWNLKEDIRVYRHKRNVGYGGVQKQLFKHFLNRNGDIGILIHSDNQYPSDKMKSLITPIRTGKADIVLASRFYNNQNYHKEMPIYKIIGNKFLTLLENIVLKSDLSEFHTGLRAYSRSFIEKINFNKYSNRFIFDSEILFEALERKFKIIEIPCYAKYEDTHSNVSSIKYGIRILLLILRYLMNKISKFRKRNSALLNFS